MFVVAEGVRVATVEFVAWGGFVAEGDLRWERGALSEGKQEEEAYESFQEHLNTSMDWLVAGRLSLRERLRAVSLDDGFGVRSYGNVSHQVVVCVADWFTGGRRCNSSGL